jgi:hypothetical protein
MKTMFYILFYMVLSGILTSCAVNLDSRISPLLKTEYLNSQLNTTPIDLSSGGQCPGTLSLKVISKDTNKDKYMVLDISTGPDCYITPEIFMKDVVNYIEEKLKESKLTIDHSGGKEIFVSIENIRGRLEGFVLKYYAGFKITIPEINYTEIYGEYEASGNDQKAIAYAVHLAIQDFLKDPVVQKYVQCRK